ncbi:hypothetical protein [Longimycelium tulufanense]|uniref:hypothetical protein n=1 Tax=Longimycelium tulufanense TaxID=907463 RepID=UPI0016693C3A|nr:hypothetical protein [Longimycelium tulufanense]
MRGVSAETLYPGNTALYVERGGSFVWSGLVWTVEPDYAGGTATLNAEGWLSYYKTRFLEDDQVFRQVDQAEIARSLLFYCTRHGPGSDIGVELGTETTGRLRDRTYLGSERKQIGEAIEQLSAVIDGFDFSFDSEWHAGRVRTVFRVHYPARGRDRGMVLEQGRNTDIPAATIDGTALVTAVTMVGADNDDGTGPVTVSRSVPPIRTPRLEAVETHADVTERSTLEEKAGHRLRLGTTPVTLPRIELYPEWPGFREVMVGDLVTVRGGYGLYPIDGQWRVTERAIEVDKTGAERIRVTVATPEVFQ